MESSHTAFYEHARPQANVNYFHNRSGMVAAFIAAYNEDAYLLDKTLHALNRQTIPNIDTSNSQSSGTTMDILIVCDGIGKMSDSMKQYITKVWGSGVITKVESWPKNAQVVISSISGCDTEFTNIGCLSILVKRNNLKKTNSHEWHLRSFISGSKYTFMTDCGTLFPDPTLGRLSNYMEEHNECVGTTGRMRGMTSEQQAPRGSWTDTNEKHTDGWVESILKAVQTVSFEERHVSEWGLANICGLLPVLHGPCSMFRTTAIEGDAIEDFFTMAYKTPAEAGMIQGNLNIAEDRVYAICAVFPKGNNETKAEPSSTNTDTTSTSSLKLAGGDQTKESGYKYTHFVEDAVFLFDLETSGRALVTQRRRWNNGTFAAHLYIIRNLPDLVWRSTNTGIVKVICTLLNLFMTFFFVLQYCFAPALYGSIFYSSWRTLLYVFLGGEQGAFFFFHVLDPYSSTSKDEREEDSFYTKIEGFVGIIVLLIYSLMYGGFLLTHMKRFDATKDEASVYHGGWWKAISVFCAINWTITFIVGVVIIPTVISGPLNAFFLWTILLIFLPKIVAVFQDPQSCWLMIKPWNLICHYLSMPVVYNFFYVYAAARFTDLTWGNRPSSWKTISVGETDDGKNDSTNNETKKCCVDGCNTTVAADSSKTSTSSSSFSDKMCEDHAWLQSNVRWSQVLNFILFLFNLFIMWLFAILNSGITLPYNLFLIIFILPVVLMEVIVLVEIAIRRCCQAIVFLIKGLMCR
jgi:cellulose synthase/poly-beta-1,6-N-acetylglucosamine synthase-like glycosyltransferase